MLISDDSSDVVSIHSDRDTLPTAYGDPSTVGSIAAHVGATVASVYIHWTRTTTRGRTNYTDWTDNVSDSGFIRRYTKLLVITASKTPRERDCPCKIME